MTLKAGTAQQVQVQELQVQVHFRPIRHCYVRVRPPLGQVEVSAPQAMSLAEVVEVVSARYEWIIRTRQRQRAAAAAQPPALPEEELADGCSWRLWGQSYRLLLQPQPGARRLRVQLEGRWVILTHPLPWDPHHAQQALLRWEQRLLLQMVHRLLPHWQAVVGRAPSAVSVRLMRTRWGSCTPSTGRIRLNHELIRHPQALLEYVLVHELTHLHVRGHGPAFTARMDAYLPDWRQRRRDLRHLCPG